MEDKKLQGKILEYAYKKYRSEAVSSFRLRDIISEFEDYDSKILIKNVEFLCMDGKIYKNGELFKEHSDEGYIPNGLLSLHITKKGIETLEKSKENVFNKVIFTLEKNKTAIIYLSLIFSIFALIISMISLYF